MSEFILDAKANHYSVTQFPSQENEAVVNVGQKKPKVISFPEGMTITFALVKYLNSTEFKSLSWGTRYATYTQLSHFVSYLSETGIKTDGQLPDNFIKKYFVYLKKSLNSKGAIRNRIYTLSKAINAVIVQLEKDGQGRELEKLPLLMTYVSHTPKIKSSENKPRQTLAEIFENCPYDNATLLRSLRLICCWALLEYERQRNLILEDNAVSKSLASLSSYSINKPPLSNSTISNRYGSTALELSYKHYVNILSFALKTKDNLIKERVLSAHYEYIDEYTPECYNELLRQLLSAYSSQKVSFNFNGKSLVCRNIYALTFKDLLCVSNAEAYFFRLFLASERVQQSNLSKLRISDLLESNIGKQVAHEKGRRPKRKRTNLTTIYKPNSLISNAFDAYINQIEKCQKWLPEDQQKLVFPNTFFSQKDVHIGFSNESSLFTLVRWMLNKKSYTSKDVLSQLSKEDAEPILWLFDNFIKRNSKHREESLTFDKIYREAKRYNKPTPPRSKTVQTNSVGLATSFVGASRIALESRADTTQKGIDGNNKGLHSDSKVSAELTAHSEATRKNIYIDRSLAPEKIESDRRFAIQMGELMEQDAAKIGEMLKQTKVLSINAIKQELGCEDADGIEDISQMQDVDCGECTELKSDNQILYVENSLTVALIVKKINKLKELLPKLRNDQLETDDKAMDCVLEILYLQSVLKKFSAKTLNEGNVLAEKLSFEFADIN